MDTLSVHAMPQPSLLGLDAGSLNHLFHCLPLKELLALSQSCKSLYNLITYEGLIWKYQLYRQFGVDLRSVASSTAQQQPLPRDFCRLLIETSKQLRPVRFTAVYTDGGVDTGAPYYWADHLFVPNTWAPYCAANAANLHTLAVLTTGHTAVSEHSHRGLLVRCLAHTLALLEQHPLPAEPLAAPVDAERLAEMAALLSSWKTNRLESFFVQMANRVALNDPVGLTMLRGLPGAREERVAAAMALAAGMRQNPWYDRAFRLAFLEPEAVRLGDSSSGDGDRGAGRLGASSRSGGLRGARAGRGGGEEDLCHVVDERALGQLFLKPDAAAATALLQGVAVSREGRFSCPVSCGALCVGVLPPAWPADACAAIATPTPTASSSAPPVTPGATAGAGTATVSQVPPQPQAQSVPSWALHLVQGNRHLGAAGGRGEAGQLGFGGAGGLGGGGVGSRPELLLQAAVEQEGVVALDDKQTAASVLAACAAGQLPPWTRHVVLEHGEWVEFLPRHLHDEAAAAGFVWRGSEGTGAGAGAGSQRGAALTALQRAASLGIPLTAAGAAAGGASTSGGGATAASASAGAWEGTAECRAARVRAAAPKLYPLVWFRFAPLAEYAPKRVATRCRAKLMQLAALTHRASELMEGTVALTHHLEQLLGTLMGAAPAARTKAAADETEQEDEEEQKVGLLAGVEDEEEEEDTPQSAGAEAAATPGTAAEAEAELLRSARRLPGADTLEGAPAAGGAAATHGSVLGLPGVMEGIGKLDSLLGMVTAAGVMAPELQQGVGYSVGTGELEALVPYVGQVQHALQELASGFSMLEKVHGALRREGEEGEEEEEEGEGEEGKGEQVRRRAAERLRKWAELCRLVGGDVRKMVRGRLFEAEARGKMEAAAALLRREAAEAEAKAEELPLTGAVTEVRNEPLLAALGLELAPIPYKSTTGVAAAAAEGDGDGHGGADNVAAEAASASTAVASLAELLGPRQQQQQQQAAGPSAAAAAAVVVLEPAPPPGFAAPGAFSPSFQADVDAGRVALEEGEDEGGHRAVHLFVALGLPVAANVVCFNAIRPENLMTVVGWDDHDKPNIDVAYLGLQGRVLVMPPGVQAV